jgi:putative oxidoreductase
VVQRLFSTFPSGWPGAGLLMLRAAVGVTATVEGGMQLVRHGAAMPATSVATGVVAVAGGASLMLGFLTPAAATLIAICFAGILLPGLPTLMPTLVDTPTVGVFVLVMTAALILLGPGAFSVDSYLFGRREIVIPPDSSRSSKP